MRENFNENLLCIGTSATMVSEGSAQDRNVAVANIASRLFGVSVTPENVITETLEPVTVDDTPMDGPSLRRAIEAGVPLQPTHDALLGHPVAALVERNLGLEDQDGKLVRISRPLTVLEAFPETRGCKRPRCRCVPRLPGWIPVGRLPESGRQRPQLLCVPPPSVHQRRLERVCHPGSAGRAVPDP